MSDNPFSSISSLSPEDIDDGPSSAQKWWASILVGVLFFVLASRPAFSFTGSIFDRMSGSTSNTYCGGPGVLGLIVHTVIFVIVIRILMG